MDFSNLTDGSGLIQECERLTGLGDTGISGSTQLKKDFASRFNQALDRFLFLAFQSQGKWQFDDDTNASAPIDTSIALVSGTQAYAIPTNAIALDKILVKDSSGVWHELTQVDHTDTESKPIWELPTGNSGVPTRFDLFGNFIYLDPIPNYSQAASLKILKLRPLTKFAYTDSTASAGIPTIFDGYLARYASALYAIEHSLSTKNDLWQLVQSDEAAIKDYFATRDALSRRALSPNVESTR